MNDDTMTAEILPDGTIKTTCDPISAANHSTAEGFLRVIAQKAGGKTTRERRKDSVHPHTHHEHEHQHH